LPALTQVPLSPGAVADACTPVTPKSAAKVGLVGLSPCAFARCCNWAAFRASFPLIPVCGDPSAIGMPRPGSPRPAGEGAWPLVAGTVPKTAGPPSCGRPDPCKVTPGGRLPGGGKPPGCGSPGRPARKPGSEVNDCCILGSPQPCWQHQPLHLCQAWPPPLEA